MSEKAVVENFVAVIEFKPHWVRVLVNEEERGGKRAGRHVRGVRRW